MADSSRQTRSQLMQLFAQQGLKPRHDLGQNFLVDLNLHDLIVRHAQLSTADVVLEIGTGTGGLTARLADAAGHVVSVEYDAHVFGHAQRWLDSRANVTLLHGDALDNKHSLNPIVVGEVRAALARVGAREAAQVQALGSEAASDNPWQLQAKPTTLKLVANLPYHVATPVISNLVASDLPWSRMVVTIQWELAQRMLAQPGTADYSALTVWMQAQSRLRIVRKLPPSVFWPPPKVDSAVLVVERDDNAQSQIVSREFLHHFLREVFTQRRKQLVGVLTRLFAEQKSSERSPGSSSGCTLSREQLEQLLHDCNIPREARAEQLPVATLVELANRLTEPRLLTAHHSPLTPPLEK